MVIEVRPKPCEELEDCSTGRGRAGLQAVRQARRSRRASRATRSPSQGFASRVYWKHVTQGELRRAGKSGSAGLSEAIALATDALSARGATAAASPPAEASAAAQAEDSSCDSQPAPQAATLNALLNTAVEAHTRKVLDQRIQNEWEMVTELPELDEYVVL
ncbi:hypothetical protein HYH03_006025 [Edaphochlamys debaryana]|uniref:Uncharacterized protein n=1 Tax=Edaphochlamys debaryana TaxID=47281 RepID=A0A835Y479_9CHLO|nr:hypothetical protein HYH03_006025 [Edaphochlamys debaryana]|eukprot:KAG2495780.1 hypothetical protein HYH03_006025 [Edaphochlamys debaryana]